jgi:hypothetical protein
MKTTACFGWVCGIALLLTGCDFDPSRAPRLGDVESACEPLAGDGLRCAPEALAVELQTADGDFAIETYDSGCPSAFCDPHVCWCGVDALAAGSCDFVECGPALDPPRMHREPAAVQVADLPELRSCPVPGLTGCR